MKRPSFSAGARLLSAALGAFALFGLGACAGDGNGDAPATGTVTLAITDAPSDPFKAVTVTISSAALLGDSGSVDIPFPDGEPITVNLLDLDGINQVLAAASIPADDYFKLRLQVTEATVTFADDTTQPVDLVANGKVDLNFRGLITVTDGGSIVIQLDFSAADSIKLTATGSGKLILRPQIFVSTTPTSDDGTTPPIDDLAGVIASRDDAERTLTLNVRRYLQVVVEATDDTVIVAEDGTAVLFGDLGVGTFVHVEGTLDTEGHVVASLIQVDTERRLTRGLVTQLDATLGTFTLLHRDETTTPVTFDAATQVFFLGSAVSTADLSNSQIVYVRGTVDTTDPTIVHATVIRIRPDRLTGTVVDASGCATGTLSVEISAAHLLARFTAAGITLSPENTIGLDLPSEFSCDGLAAGAQIRVFGRLTPHVPDATDPNPVRFLVVNRSVLPWHGGVTGIIVVLPQAEVTGTVGTVTPNTDNPSIGTFVLTVAADAELFCDRDGRALSGDITVVVTASTQFDEGLEFSSALEGQNVTVEGVITARLQLLNITDRLNINLVATEVHSAGS
jgi:hypothetical protein